MKYYYGNSVKEALSNPPVDIETTNQLDQYNNAYNVVIEAEAVPPTEVEMEIDSCLADSLEDTDYVEEVIDDYLGDEYGYCVEGYTWEVDGDKIKITNIEWDLTC